MATAPKKLTDYLLKSLPLSGGGFGIANTTPAVMPNTYVSPGSIRIAAAPAPVAPVTPAPVIPATAPRVAPSPAPIFSSSTAGPSAAPVGPPGATGAAPASQIPQQYLKADGTLKTPAEVAADIGSTLKAAHGNGDVGTLALGQFGANDKSAVQLEAEARRVGNTRNDIAVGETDPYKVASGSGIAYTAAELNAIEKAYAGIYDPALDTALAKVTDKQNSDKAKATADAQANQSFTLGKDQVRYDKDGNIIAVGASSDISPGGAYVAGQNSVVDAYVKGSQNGTYKPSDIPDQYKDMVAQGVAATKPVASKTSTDAISVINELQGIDDSVLGRISGQGFIGGVEHPSSLFPGSAVQPVQNLAKQLNGILSLANRTQLKGQGAISDFEFRVLGDAASALGLDANGRTNLSLEDFKNQLNKIKLKLQVGETGLTDDEIQYLSNQGYTPDQIRAADQSQSFNDVGNTKASPLSTGQGNIPQRNNNPGNVKAGGLADSLAVGKDKYGHLIFPDAETGFKALTADVTAKINGGSSRLPKNPTIAQLGAVYAEDTNWPKKVAAILGVPIETHTGTVPIDKLVQAIAKQEGFYA